MKTERVSVANKKVRDSLKENAQPNNQDERISVDEGIQMGSEPDLTTGKDKEIKRSMSVEVIQVKPVEIDITDDSVEKMPPPPIPVKKKKAQKQGSHDLPADQIQPMPVRITRSKIKKEKTSIGKSVSSKELQNPVVNEDNHIQKSISESVIQNETHKVNDTTTSSVAAKKGTKKKYPIPILVKIERTSTEENVPKTASPSNAEVPNNDAEKSPPPVEKVEKEINFPINETVTINTNLPVNQTITLANNVNETYNKNIHDSLMTDDNDEDTSMELPLAQSVVQIYDSMFKTY